MGLSMKRTEYYQSLVVAKYLGVWEICLSNSPAKTWFEAAASMTRENLLWVTSRIILI